MHDKLGKQKKHQMKEINFAHNAYGERIHDKQNLKSPTTFPHKEGIATLQCVWDKGKPFLATVGFWREVHGVKLKVVLALGGWGKHLGAGLHWEGWSHSHHLTPGTFSVFCGVFTETASFPLRPPRMLLMDDDDLRGFLPILGSWNDNSPLVPAATRSHGWEVTRGVAVLPVMSRMAATQCAHWVTERRSRRHLFFFSPFLLRIRRWKWGRSRSSKVSHHICQPHLTSAMVRVVLKWLALFHRSVIRWFYFLVSVLFSPYVFREFPLCCDQLDSFEMCP